jgi:hypothetical protein
MGSIYINSLSCTFTTNAKMMEVPITDSKVESKSGFNSCIKINEKIRVLFLSLVFQFVQSDFWIRPVQYNIQYLCLKDVVCVTGIIQSQTVFMTTMITIVFQKFLGGVNKFVVS